MATDENVVGGRFQFDITDLKAGLTEANRLLRLSNSEFQASAAGLGDWSKSEEGLNAKIKQLNTNIDIQKKKVAALQSEYEKIVAEQGENSKAAQEMAIKLNNETKALKDSEKQLTDTKEALENYGEEAEEAGESTSKLGSIAGGIGGAIAGVGAAVAAAGAALFSTVEATKEYRAELSKLEQNAKSNGNNFAAMKDELTDITAITGDSGAAVEALSNLMAAGFDDAGMTEALDALSGAVLKFPDTLKIEGLADGLQETLATGAAAGTFAELIERMGGNVDEFNEGLADCTTEAEKQQYALEWLAESGLAEVSAEYEEANKNALEYEKANIRMTDAIAGIATVVQPVVTMLKSGLASILENLVGILNGTEGATAGFTEAIGNMAKNIVDQVNTLLPILITAINALVPALINGIITALPLLAEGAVQIVTSLITTILTALPQLAEVAVQIITTLVDGIITAIPVLIPAIVEVVIQIVNTLIENIPVLLEAAVQLLMALVDAIPTIIEALVEALPGVIDTILEALIDSIPILLEAAIQLLMALVDAIPTIIKALIDNLPKIITTIVDNLISNLPLVLDAAIQLLMALIDAIPTIIKALVDNLPKIISTLTSTLINNAPKILKAAIELLWGLIKAIPEVITGLVKNIPSIITSIVNGLKEGVSLVFDVGEDIIRGLWNGISNMSEWISKKIKGFGEGVLNGIKNFFGIESPSKVMRDEVGTMLAQGIGVGFEKEMSKVKKGIVNSADLDFVMSSGSGNSNMGAANVNGSRVINFTQINNSPKALSRADIYINTKSAARLALNMM